jgi:type VI protein secretion system component Hcp
MKQAYRAVIAAASFFLLATAGMSPGSASTAAGAHALLKVPGVEGGSAMAHYRGWSDLLAFSFGGVTDDPKLPTAPVPLELTKAIDSASPIFAKLYEEQRVVPGTTELLFITPEGVELKVSLTDIVVISDRWTANGTAAPVEKIGLSYTKIMYCAETACAGWDYKTGQPEIVR